MMATHHTASSEPCVPVSRYTALPTARQPFDRDNLRCSNQPVFLQVLTSYLLIESYVAEYDNHYVTAVG